MNIYAWIEYFYYDGLLTFANLRVSLDPVSPIRHGSVKWLGEVAEVNQ